MDDSSCVDGSTGKGLFTLIVKLPGSFEDDLIILHCEVPSNDPMTAFEHIEVTGVLTHGHLTAKEAQERYSVLSNMVDNP